MKLVLNIKKIKERIVDSKHASFKLFLELFYKNEIRMNQSPGFIISFKNNFVVVEGDYTNYPMDIPYFEGVGSTVVNGFTTANKNMLDASKFRKGAINWDNGLLENDNLKHINEITHKYIKDTKDYLELEIIEN